MSACLCLSERRTRVHLAVGPEPMFACKASRHRRGLGQKRTERGQAAVQAYTQPCLLNRGQTQNLTRVWGRAAAEEDDEAVSDLGGSSATSGPSRNASCASFDVDDQPPPGCARPPLFGGPVRTGATGGGGGVSTHAALGRTHRSRALLSNQATGPALCAAARCL